MAVRNLTLATVSLLVLASSVGGCGDDDDGGSSTDLTGRTFVATTVEGQELVPGSEVIISFTEDLIVIEAGCNSMRGGYAIEDGELRVDPLASTNMACEEPLMDQDLWMAEFLQSGPAVEVDDGLVLSNDTVRISLDESS